MLFSLTGADEIVQSVTRVVRIDELDSLWIK